MGVDISVTVGVGFEIDPEVWTAYTERIDPEGELDPEEFFGRLKSDTTGLDFGTGGSYYDDGKNNRDYISVNRLTKDWDVHDLPGGFRPLGKPVVTLAEREALNAVAKEIGLDSPEITQFISVLWC